jgi:SAM-dependent methyltransferase
VPFWSDITLAVTNLNASPEEKRASKGLLFPEMALAHEFCLGSGIELGAASHNPFGLPGSINLAPWSDDPAHIDFTDYQIYRSSQIENCGQYARVDLVGEADAIPVEANTQDYVISSHVIEHLPNLIGAFFEWNRVLKPGGVVFMVFPKRNALLSDIRRPITLLDDFIEDYQQHFTVDTHPLESGHRPRGHYHVFTLDSMLELIDWCNREIGLSWRVEAVEETDSKVGNGHTVVCRYLPGQTFPSQRLTTTESPLQAPRVADPLKHAAQVTRTAFSILFTQGPRAFISRSRRWLRGERPYFS